MTDKATAPASAKLRGDIESGRPGDGKAANDPDAAPPGTDPEAASAPPRREEIAWARSGEIAHDEAADDGGTRLWHGRSLIAPAILLGVCAGFVIVAAVLFFNAS